MKPIKYDGNEIELTFHQRAPETPRPPDGVGAGGVWLLWVRKEEA